MSRRRSPVILSERSEPKDPAPPGTEEIFRLRSPALAPLKMTG